MRAYCSDGTPRLAGLPVDRVSEIALEISPAMFR